MLVAEWAQDRFSWGWTAHPSRTSCHGRLETQRTTRSGICTGVWVSVARMHQMPWISDSVGCYMNLQCCTLLHLLYHEEIMKHWPIEHTHTDIYIYISYSLKLIFINHTACKAACVTCASCTRHPGFRQAMKLTWGKRATRQITVQRLRPLRALRALKDDKWLTKMGLPLMTSGVFMFKRRVLKREGTQFSEVLEEWKSIYGLSKRKATDMKGTMQCRLFSHMPTDKAFTLMKIINWCRARKQYGNKAATKMFAGSKALHRKWEQEMIAAKENERQPRSF